MNLLRKAWAYLRSLPRLYSIGGAVVIIAALAIGVHFLTRAAPAPAAEPTVPHVSLASAADLSSQSGPLSIVGKITSLNHATILAQTSGELVSLSLAIGDQVAAGSVIGQFENSSQQAAVLQAQGSYNAAAASRAATSLPETETQARNAYLSAYTTLDTALQSDIDTFFGSQTPYGPAFLINSEGTDSDTLSRERQSIQDAMNAWRASLPEASTTEPGTLLDQAYATTQTVSVFVTDIARSANARGSRATSDQLAALATARTSVNTLLSTLSAARDAYRTKSVGATTLTDASVMQAQGGLDAAKAALEKTIIRSPISGTIVSLPVNQGDYVSQGTQVAVVSNPGALEVEAYVTPDDARTLAVGSKAAIDGSSTGVIVSIAPALDPTTNKIEVKIGITGGESALTDGETVTVGLTRSAASSSAKAPTAITIPIAAVKITPDGAAVFAVSDGKLVSMPIELGTIYGTQITIVSGLTPDAMIVTDARGLSNGEMVIVNDN